jgi:hypothetical protein
MCNVLFNIHLLGTYNIQYYTSNHFVYKFRCSATVNYIIYYGKTTFFDLKMTHLTNRALEHNLFIKQGSSVPGEQICIFDSFTKQFL